jgi:heptaprenyl diphosphate synthase
LQRKSYPISQTILTDLAKVDTALKEELHRYNGALQEAASLTVKAGGKRLRPALVLICGQAGRYDLSKLMPAALAVELLHTATLVHDDVLDVNPLRRGLETVNARWGSKTAIATGDMLLGKSFSLMSGSMSPEAVKVLAEAALDLSAGEMMQQRSVREPDTGVDEYLERVRLKTAVLFKASCFLGVSVSGADTMTAEALGRYGEHLGMAFQIFDDVLDIVADEEILGKPVGGDLRDGTPTYPVISALGKNGSDVLHKIMTCEEPDELDVQASLGFIKQCGAIEESRELAKSYIDKSYTVIEEISNKGLKQELRDVGQFVIDRYN